MKEKLQGKVVCVALNDSQQLDNLTSIFEQAPYKAPPTEPVLYFKPHNTWNQDNRAIQWPGKQNALVVGASLAVIIGKTCCRVTQEEALDYVEGFALLHDFSLPETSYYRPDIKGKCLDNSLTLSAPVQVSDLNNYKDLELVTAVNGSAKRYFPLSRLSRGTEQLLEKISHIMTLDKGDIIAIGFAGERVELQPYDKITSTLGNALRLENIVSGGEQ
ncbi:fumarylacetoacetate hydrolase family protein [Vibrio hangzhouensis]|uniref:5-oxopent-3-ene-1,2,5-tricarboxylate decarboxylase / 2-hydroxyhepta-2,4-diene-1,7-dioate isomerase n=1 Tax=Vibrio hangzhouensis TaxID=462991 RepID=A0A1H6AYU2_9VIBR|nr:fumarylacetoacetate hydrolase family protein [Vibrio hangzhouensis]SEG53470.1 5-oxopent-3-ene-1,2,5-tricarboxylate decarboxylase / 2-hydroxyhepta-2,4-diene-1,7-dioate isomerase [Vibrio hangzhouensis]